MKRLLLCALVIFFAASPIAKAQARNAADSRWAVNDPEDGPNPRNKRISCHALKYFQDIRNLKELDYGGGLMADSPEDNADKVDTERRGEISGFAIYDVIHRVGRDDPHATDEQFFRMLKMILVERKPGEFCEIYHEQGESEMLNVDPCYVGDIGAEKVQVLVTYDRISGTGNNYNEAYWTFDKEGPIPLDLDVIDDAVGKVIPDGTVVRKGGAFDIGTLTYDSGVWKEDDPNCCPSAGDVHVKFALKEHKLVVVEKKFEPAKDGADKSDAIGIFFCGLFQKNQFKIN